MLCISVLMMHHCFVSVCIAKHSPPSRSMYMFQTGLNLNLNLNLKQTAAIEHTDYLFVLMFLLVLWVGEGYVKKNHYQSCLCPFSLLNLSISD